MINSYKLSEYVPCFLQKKFIAISCEDYFPVSPKNLTLHSAVVSGSYILTWRAVYRCCAVECYYNTTPVV